MLNKKYPVLYLTAGLDEVGRGALVGNVVAGAVILDNSKLIQGLKDSKKLSYNKRTKLSVIIKLKALSWSIGIASSREIDFLNISNATKLAMKRAIFNLSIQPNFIFLDGKFKLNINMPCLSIIRGDNIISEIKAASIIAKDYRDREMLKLHNIFPKYKFNKNKGYPTSHHLKMIRNYGITKFHRSSFAPISKMQ
ncbi:ribonuclease HII [Buchnera aphidicola (Nipponaphis monzeni)]|uniref:Ribonuclease HII n=1 Tax=Buchnera aphidicola (Nipponaphis monzeni) TaxID=2495405 RepID=A0A455TA43_9GAMM|nr:ribonuclease HII [Buchnera aphidicola]BBI01201.1 ribonuclease HII [Buchnera aphidicola (Nipponaphis monzeni)]